MSSKPVKFYAPPSIIVQVAIPQRSKNAALGRLRQLAKTLKLRLKIKEKHPDTNFPNATYYAFQVSANYKIDSAEKLVTASNAITQFQSLFQAAIMIQNTPEIKGLQ